jgi:hypothetical protein
VNEPYRDLDPLEALQRYIEVLGMGALAMACEEILAAHGAPEDASQHLYYTGPPGPQPTLEDVAVLVDLPQTGPEWDAFLRSIGVAP